MINNQKFFTLEGKEPKIITRVVAIANLKKYIGKDLRELALLFNITTFETGKQNKGWKGHVLERLAGLDNNNSKAPNGLGFELKSIAFEKCKNGSKYCVNGLRPKETMAITMLNKEELKQHSFFESHCWNKLKSLIVCAVMWHGKNADTGELIRIVSLDFAKTDDLIQEIKEDYDLIRKKFLAQGFESLTGSDGKWIQARTKGPGGKNPRTGLHRPQTRAFYARRELVSKIFALSE